ncbi:MAG: hypothetical protein ABW061_18740 [Polyangiaceae bacterium]
MSWQDDVRDREPIEPRPKVEVHSFPVPPGKFERAAMAGFCESLSPEDWILLESMGTRLRNALLKQTIAIALQWRKRRRAKTSVTSKKEIENA